MDSGTSVSALNLPTYLMIPKMGDISSSGPLGLSKTIMIANKSEAPKKHCITVTYYTPISESSRHFRIPFAIDDYK